MTIGTILKRGMLGAAGALLAGAAMAQDARTPEDLGLVPVNPRPAEIIREVPAVSLNGVRVAGEDTEALADFYENAFGMWEVQRIPLPGNPEIMLNFGATAEEAMANPNGDVVIYPTSEAFEDPIAHIVFDVSDAQAVAAEIARYGGTVLREPFEYGDTGIVISIAADPAGNQIELIQPAAQ